MSTVRPYLSIIVPVKNGHSVLPRCLDALLRSDLPREVWELIVIDDGSTDDSAVIAAAYADLVIRLPGRSRGPAYARNRGAERARGECVMFIDADVLVHPDTLRRMVHVFATEPDVHAVFGSYDDTPEAPGLVSQYRNLLHHYTHGQNPGDAHTFWAGCGAVRRSTFVAAGMYDEWRFPRPQVEDIELGHRIRALGARIVLRPEIQAKHLKRWTLRNMMATDFHDRGIPWARLLAGDGALLSVGEAKARVLNLRTQEKVNTVLVWLALMAVLGGIFLHQPLALAGVALVLPVFWSNRGTYAFFERKRGFLFAVRVVPLHLLYYLIAGVSAGCGIFIDAVVGDPRPEPTIEAMSEVGVQTWPPIPSNPQRAGRPPLALPFE